MEKTKIFKTNKGTIIPISNIKGQNYMQVQYRLIWFREEHPDWGIDTKISMKTETSCLAQARITDSDNKLVGCGHKFETKQNFNDFIEKAETGAIGRALASIGYGTQFAPDLSEGERIVDAPSETNQNTYNANRQTTQNVQPAQTKQALPNRAPKASVSSKTETSNYMWDQKIEWGKNAERSFGEMYSSGELFSQPGKKGKGLYNWAKEVAKPTPARDQFVQRCEEFQSLLPKESPDEIPEFDQDEEIPW